MRKWHKVQSECASAQIFSLKKFKSLLCPKKLQQLRQTITTGKGTYQDFLQRWGYDAEQQQAIAHVLSQVILP